MFSDAPALKSNEASFDERLHSRCDESIEARLDVSTEDATVHGFVHTFSLKRDLRQPDWVRTMIRVSSGRRISACLASLRNVSTRFWNGQRLFKSILGLSFEIFSACDGFGKIAFVVDV